MKSTRSFPTDLKIEGDIFQTIIPLQKPKSDQASDQEGDQASDYANEQKEGYLAGLTPVQQKVADYCKTPRTRAEIQNFTNIKSPRYLREYVLKPLVQKQVLHLTLSDKPTSPNQKYYLNKSLTKPR